VEKRPSMAGRKLEGVHSCDHNENNNEAKYVLTRKVLSHHNSANDAWVVHNGSVYDITMFLESHPGGSDILNEHLGKDVSTIMRGDDGVSGHDHSAFAYKLLERYRIGEVVDAKDGERALDGNIDSENGEELVKWDKPILDQVRILGDKYHRWIHSFPTTDHTLKMFTGPRLSAMTDACVIARMHGPKNVMIIHEKKSAFS